MMEIRLAATRYIWGAFALIMLGLISTTIFGGNGGLGLSHVIIASVVALAAFLSTGTVWNWGDASQGAHAIKEATKQKRASVDRLADEIDSMSDADLERLRSRLSGDVREVLSTSAYHLDDDGELLRR
jgi:Na+-translocating ferredoxin:NAD+ oxidoreductase RnfD subunit